MIDDYSALYIRLGTAIGKNSEEIANRLNFLPKQVGNQGL